jgi:ribosomal-protein-alanine N-acetyltransferase
MEILNLTTPRLNIRNLQITDLSDFHVYRSNPETTKYQGLDVMDIEQAADFIKENSTKHFGKAGEWIQYGIENRKTGKLIGDCAIKLDQREIRFAEIGITISRLNRTKGMQKKFY